MMLDVNVAAIGGEGWNEMSEVAEVSAGRALRLTSAQTAIAVVVIFTVLRFALVPTIPLAFDEAYYWRWSTELSFGYFDHPPLVAWLIDLGTWIAGDTELGVRLVPVLLSVPASWAVWRSADILFGNRSLALTALVFFNLTLIVSVGTILASPDASLLAASAFLLFSLAKLSDTGRPYWWLIAGLVAGIGCLAKFTALFWLPSVLIWLILTPRMRPWLATPWPWLGAVVAFLVFFPNLVWNANHDWVTFAKQFGRVSADGFAPQHIIEHLGAQIGVTTPIIFILGWLGLAAIIVRRGGPTNARVMIGALVWPTSIYFLFHALHARVEANWTGPIFPAFAIAAAAAIYVIDWHGSLARFVAAIRPWATPVGIVVVLAIYGQAAFSLLPLGGWDPTISRLGEGIPAVAEEVEQIRQAEGATMILTADYPTTGWMSFYISTRSVVFQFNEPERWLQEPGPTPAQRAGPFVAVLLEEQSITEMEAEYGPAELVSTIERTRGTQIVSRYAVYRFAGD